MSNVWLRPRDFFDLPITANEATVTGHRVSLGYIQMTLTVTSTKLVLPTTIPPGVTIGYVVIQCIGAAATDYGSWRDDTVAPTPTVSMRLYSQQELDYSGEFGNMFWVIGSGSPVLNITYYA